MAALTGSFIYTRTDAAKTVWRGTHNLFDVIRAACSSRASRTIEVELSGPHAVSFNTDRCRMEATCTLSVKSAA